MKTPQTFTNLRNAIDNLRKLDVVNFVEEFRKFEHSCHPGTYCALILNPATGEIRFLNEASWCCSTNEYFSESGALSDVTLISCTRAYWSPGPDDSFELDYKNEKNDYAHPKDDFSGWVPKDQFYEVAEKLIAEKLGIDIESAEIKIGDPEYVLSTFGWEFFSISNTPVDGWVPDGEDDETVKNVKEKIENLIACIELEIDVLDNAG
jgi:hypothetical protein